MDTGLYGSGTGGKHGWQEPKEKKRIYLVSDNTRMTDFERYVRERDLEAMRLSAGIPRENLGVHEYRGALYSSNYAGICRLKGQEGRYLRDEDGNELILKVVPRFGARVEELLNDLRADDEFDRYLAPQTRSVRHQDREIEGLDRNELFYFFQEEKPIKLDSGISEESSIIAVTVFLNLLKALCRRPLMGRMLKEERNLSGKVRGKIVMEKNIRHNTMGGRSDRFYCRYLRYTDNIPENQILKAALKKAKRFLSEYFGAYIQGDNGYGRVISYCSHALKGIDDVKCSGSDCRGLKFTGCYTYYKPVIDSARMILDDISLDFNGRVSVSGYVMPYAVSMEKLFEVWVRAFLKRKGVKSYRFKSGEGILLEKYDDKTQVFREEALPNPGRYISGSIKPDIVLTDLKTGKKAVYDVKYKDYRNADGRNDRLQLLAYSMMLNADHIGIIFPAPDREMIFDPRRINTLEDREVIYHQLLIDIGRQGGGVPGINPVSDYCILQNGVLSF